MTASNRLHDSDDLKVALCDLRGACDEARDACFPLPSGLALKNAKRMLQSLFCISPRRYEVFPTRDGEIAIDAPGGPGRSVVLLCNSDGGALCVVNMNGKHRRTRYNTAEEIPDGFIRESLDELSSEGDNAS